MRPHERSGAPCSNASPSSRRQLADYAGVVGVDVVDRIPSLAEPLQGARVLHLNATAYGGGVAELLATHVPLLRSVGIDADWQVMHGQRRVLRASPRPCTTRCRAPTSTGRRAMQRIYLEKVLDNALLFDGHYDFVVVHDPQPAAILSFLRERLGGAMSDTKWIWRCHIDLTDANPKVWEFFRPFVELHDASVWTMPRVRARHRSRWTAWCTAPPCIDPLSVKNLDLALPFCQELTRQYGVDVHRPIVCQVSRFDPWKDPVGVIEAFRIVRERVPDAQLVLAGSMATDDPEGFRVWDETEAARAGDRDIYLLSNLHQVGSVQINAFQRIANVVVQKSLREGFGLTVSEALWKGRPVVGGRAGGIKLQIRDGYDGYLVDSVEECAQRTIDLLADPVGADALGAQGREHVRENFLSTRELEDWLRLFGELRAHDRRLAPRAVPVLGRATTARSLPARGPGGLAGTLHPLAASTATARRARCVSRPRSSDDDRAAMAAARRRRRSAPTLALRRPRSRRCTACTTTSSRTRCCGSCFHGIFDLAAHAHVRRRVPRRVGRLRGGERGVRRRGRRRTRADGDVVLVQDYPLALVPGMRADGAARPPASRTSPTPRSAVPTSIRVLPDRRRRGAVRGRWPRVPCGFHTDAVGARRTRRRPREVLGPDADVAPTFVAPLGPDPDALAAIAGVARGARTRPRELDDARRRPQARSSAPTASTSTKNIVRGLRAPTTSCSRTIPSGASGVVFVAHAQPRRARASPEYLAYRKEVDAGGGRA